MASVKSMENNTANENSIIETVHGTQWFMFEMHAYITYFSKFTKTNAVDDHKQRTNKTEILHSRCRRCIAQICCTTVGCDISVTILITTTVGTFCTTKFTASGHNVTFKITSCVTVAYIHFLQ